MTIVLGAEKASDAWTSGTSFTISGITQPTAGNTMILYYNSLTAGQAVTSLVQTNATWVLADAQATGRQVEIWYTTALTGTPGTTITVNLSGTPSTAGQQSACVSEWSASGQLTLDTANSQTATSTTPAIPTLTPTAGRSAVVIGAIRAGGAVSGGPTGGTALLSSDAGVRGYGAYNIVDPTTGTYDMTWTTGSSQWGSVGAVFLEPAASVPYRAYYHSAG
jgi:hypothetical protein